MQSPSEIGKKAAGEAAAELVQPGMLLGLGTGSTVSYFIQRLAVRCRSGLDISAVASSERSAQLAKDLAIPLLDIDALVCLDLTVDGADEIDPLKRMIKGGGGALLREKIIASMSKEMLVIVDESKCVNKLGTNYPLPVEIVPFAWRATISHLNDKQLTGHLRMAEKNRPFVTDNGNYIYDIAKEALHSDVEALNHTILAIPGVVETGFFFNLATKVLVGCTNGQVEMTA